MDVITKIRDRARAKQRTIVLPEYNDERVIEAVKLLNKEGICKAVLFTPEMVDKNEMERYIQDFYAQHRAKDMELDVVRKLFTSDTLYYTAMMTAENKFDGLVAGASHTTPDMVRASMRCLGIDERITIVSSCFIMDVPNCPYGEKGTFVFADCGVIPEPNSRQLACIALSAAEMGHKVLDLEPRIAFLSYSTKGSARTKSAEKIVEALGLLKEMAPELLADGELQVDAAIVP